MSTSAGASPVKILLIDDDPGVVRALSAQLRREGYDTLAALDAVQATMFARKESPAAIVLDLGLPGGDGLRVLENLARSAATAAIPVLVLSGRDDPRTFARAKALGAVDCFTKGVDAEPLLSRIRAIAGPPVPPSAADVPATQI